MFCRGNLFTSVVLPTLEPLKSPMFLPHRRNLSHQFCHAVQWFATSTQPFISVVLQHSYLSKQSVQCFATSTQPSVVLPFLDLTTVGPMFCHVDATFHISCLP